MNNNRLGCLSPSAIIAALFTLLVISGFWFFSGSRLFSSGSLNAKAGESLGGVSSHAEIGSDCARCHPSPWDADTLGDRCVRCHTDVTAQLADPTSMHGVLMKNNSLTCRACHTDHRGPDASLTDMTSGNFPHNSTGYSLASHRQRSDGLVFTCSDCHANDITRFDPVVCSTCHQQIDSAFLVSHNQAYGTDCRGCHDGMETISKNFDHSRLVFKLEGKHQGLVCEKCHLSAHTVADFKSVSTDCSACHLKDDAHKGEFGKDCAVCHKPAGWKPAIFDHNLSAFKLEGKHADAKCTDCHINNVFKGTSSVCFSCHQKDDEHGGKFGQDCGACHSAKAWKPANFDHNLSAFKLDGKHTDVACDNCHKNNVFKGTPAECGSCHADPVYHAGMFPGQACSVCHSTAAWRPAPYDGPHTFPMNHGEKNNTCADCHQPTLKQWTCYTCHDQGETARKHQEERISNFDDCLRCHATGEEEGGD